ncbi:Glycosylphosphatidylinositol (GPI) anchor assembly protein [Leucoagaricus gongylophorus]
MKNAKATVKTSSNSNPSTKYSVPSSPGEVFPGNSYIPVVGVHVTLLTFNALFLPRTTFLQELTNIPIDLAQLSSLDRPQHPFLDPLTLSPLTTTLYICFGAAILQSWWAGYIREWWSLILVDGSENEQLEKVLLDRQKIKAFTTAWITTFAASLIFHFILILFGAPFFWYSSRTYAFALLLSILSIYTPAFVFGPPGLGSSTASFLKRLHWIRLFAEFTIRSPIERAVVYPAVGSFIGAWLGAIPIALDWDRPWQAWPLTPVYGTITGYIIGSLISLTINTVRQFVLEQKRLQLADKQL